VYGLFLTKKEEINVYKATFDDLYEVGVLARVLRIIQWNRVVHRSCSTWKKGFHKEAAQSPKHLKAQIVAHEDIVTKIQRVKGVFD